MSRTFRFTVNSLTILAGILVGWLSARYMMANATAEGTTAGNNWQEIRLGGDGLAPTYQAANYLWQGEVPPPANVRIFSRRLDDQGETLRGECAVMLEGMSPEARWWFVTTEGGGSRSALSAPNIIREPDNQYVITVSRDPMPGNWLATSRDGAYVLRLVIEDGSDGPVSLPRVRKLWC